MVTSMMEVKSDNEMHKDAKGKRLAALVGVVRSSLGVLFGIAILVVLADSTRTSLLLPPFAASAALAFAAPDNPFGRPRSIFGGYLISATSSLPVLAVLGYGSVAKVVAVSVSVATMLVPEAKNHLEKGLAGITSTADPVPGSRSEEVSARFDGL